MNTNTEYLIIGAGPAGLQLGYYLAQNGRDYLILERNSEPGSFFKTYPRHRTLISINKVYTGTDNPEANMRWDWNSLLSDRNELLFKDYSERYFPDPDDLHRYLQDYAEQHEIQVKYDTSVKQISKNEDGFSILDENGNRYQSKRLIIATGLFKPYIPDIPGIELCNTYNDHEIDPKAYINKRVLVVGKGNSAFETADNLVETAAAIHILSPESVKFAWQTHFVGHLRAVNNNFLDTYQLKSQNTVIDAEIIKVEKVDGQYVVHLAYSHAKGQTAKILYDNVILCTGFRMDTSIFDESCQPELMIHDKFPAQTMEWESTNIEDLYFAGTLMQACDYKKTMSGFIHGFRHNIQSLVNVLEHKYHDNPWPAVTLELDPEAVLSKVIERVNTGPGMFLQPGFLCDVVVIHEFENMAKYYMDVRKDFVPASWFGEHGHYYTISLEYGKFGGDPFNIERDPHPEKGQEAAYLHPVIRRFDKGVLVAQHHINDDLESAWHKEIYVAPAREFFQEQLATDQEMDAVPR